MRTVMIGAALLASAGAAEAGQRMVTHGPGMVPPPVAAPAGVRGQHWGGRSGGYWVGGVRAPGGYRAYRRPLRGYVVPSYWLAPNFFINDWGLYGLSQPPLGYHWSRYYDDAVLLDGRGSVYDSVEGLDWDRYDLDAGGAYTAGPGYPPPPGAGYAPPGAGYPPPPPGGYYGHRDSGTGGALAGAAVGGAFGAVAGGRHDRAGGALIGAGAGALAGYAIDRAGDRHRHERMASPYGAEYPMPGPGYPGPGAYPPPSPGPGYPGPGVIAPGGATTTVTTTSAGGYGAGTWVNGVYYGPGVTTVTVQTAPVVTTTTTTEVIEDSVTYSHPVTRRVYKRRWQPRGKLQCRCGS